MVQKKIKKKFGMKFQGVGEIVVLNCKVDRQPPFCTNSKKKKKKTGVGGMVWNWQKEKTKI